MDVRTVKPYLEDLHVGTLPILIFFQVEQVIQNWTNHNHPTRKSAILSLFPNMLRNEKGCPSINACTMEPSLKDIKCDQYETCGDCNKDFWLMPLN